MDTRARIESEFEGAQQARAHGNEGRARVCARRAAGIGVREYFSRRGIPMRSTSAVDLLNQLRDDTELPPALRPLVDHLMLRVDEEFRLPPGVDLIAEARLLCDALFPV